jgi:hypothetical protein
MIRFAVALCVGVCAGWSSSASAQIFYEPVQYQYTFGSTSFFYGGRAALVFDRAASTIRAESYSSTARTIHAVNRGYIYSDNGPLTNLADRGYGGYHTLSAADARNEACNNLPRYFRKIDLLRAAVPLEDGTWVVPAQARPRVEIRAVRPFVNPSAAEAPKGTILIVPRRLLDKKPGTLAGAVD